MPRRFRLARIYRPRSAGSPDPPLKIAVVLSGAVALGTFEAGVVYELLRAISRGVPLTLDLVVGSSAGAMVGAMIVKSLVMGAPFEVVLSRWTEFTLHELTANYETEEQATIRRKPLDRGILSSESVRRILEQHLVDDPVQRNFQPGYPAPRVVLTMTLTNLDGLPGTGGPDDENRFAEAVTFRFTPTNPRKLHLSPYPPAVWKRLAHMVRAGSAFPGAFDPDYIPWRDRMNIPGLLEEHWENEPLLEKLHRQDPALQPKMRYADGGILDEQPVERAISSLPFVTGGRNEAGVETLVYDPRRCFLFIEPDPPATSLDALKAGTPQSWFATFSRGLRLWTLGASPHTSQRRVHSANQRQERLCYFLADLARRMREEGRAPAVHQALSQFRQRGDVSRTEIDVSSGLIDPVLYKQAVHRFYRWLVDDGRFQQDMDWLDRLPPGRMKDAHASIRAALLELREAYLALEGVDPTAPGRFQAVLEEVHASLAESLGLAQPWVALHEIMPEDPERMLKGEEIVHFGGFFSREFLKHDFEVGRYYAYLWLREAVHGYDPEDKPAMPPVTEEGLNWPLLWQNRVPLWRMAGRLVGVLLEAVGLRYDGAGQLLVRLLGWSLLLSAVHGVLLLIGAWFGWITFPPQYQQFRFWLLMGTSLFPLTMGLVLGLAFRREASRLLAKRRERERPPTR